MSTPASSTSTSAASQPADAPPAAIAPFDIGMATVMSTAAAPSTDAAAPPAAAAAAATAAAAPSATASSSGSHGRSLETRRVALSGDQLAYFGIMRDRYNLGSLDKTARCLVNYALRDGDQRHIFGTIRCRKCGIRFPKQEVELQLYPHQWEFLDRMRLEYKIRDDDNNCKALRCLLDFTQEGRCKRGMTDEEKGKLLQALEVDVFTKIRCNDPVCTHQH